MKTLSSLLLILLSSSITFGQDVTNTVSGTVIDQQSEFPIPGAKVVIIESNPIKRVLTDLDGNFEIIGVPVGRLTIEITYPGYEPSVISNLELKSGKQLSVNIGLEESIVELDEVKIVYKDNKSETINNMTSVSARTISTEEAGKFAGTLNDPARMVQNYAGVSGGSDDRNDIIIRGNSPLGVLWRMDGIDIPSPNHFSTLGTTGGPVSMLNINNLSNSDFYTSAWTADFGNALSGVFDLRLRSGNRNKREYIGQVGFNGFELGAEGPFSMKNKKASYLINYRYSTLGVLSALGIDLGVGTAVPQYQDITFKVDVPTKKAGRFTLWGIGGVSFIKFDATGIEDSTNLFNAADQNSQFGSQTAVIGGSHKYFFNKNTFSELIVAFSVTKGTGFIDSLPPAGPFNLFGFDHTQLKSSLNYKINHKFNARNTITTGIIAEHYATDIIDSAYRSGSYRTIADNKGSAFLFQGYVNYQHKFNEKLLFNGGIHSQHFLLTESHVVEPRIGFKYKMNPRHTVSIGSGMHSQIQPITVYFTEEQQLDGSVTLPNQSLGFSKSVHNVLAYDFQITKNMRLKTEVYYQYLYGIPVDSIPSYFAMSNQGRDFTLPTGTGYINDGTGTNYGLEVTFERFYDKGYYFLLTSSIFESKYIASDGIERNTAFNGNYVFNVLGGKEFNLSKSVILGFDIRTTYSGGARYSPIDLDASIIAGRQVIHPDQVFEATLPNYFRTDFKITLKHNGERINQEFSIDLQNISNQRNIFQRGYNALTQKIGVVYQRGFFPNVQYKINF